MPFDPTKPARTRDGRPARILAADLKCNFPIAAAVTSTDGQHEMMWVFYVFVRYRGDLHAEATRRKDLE